MENLSPYLYLWVNTPDYTELGRILFRDEPFEVVLRKAFRSLKDDHYEVQGGPTRLTLTDVMVYHGGDDREIPLCLTAKIQASPDTDMMGGVKMENRVRIALYCGDKHANGVVDTITRYPDDIHEHKPIEQTHFVWQKDDYDDERETARQKFTELLDMFQRGWTGLSTSDGLR